MDSLLKSDRFGTGKEIQLVDVIMPVMDAPRALQEQARLLEKANRRVEETEPEARQEAPPSKKRKVEKVTAEVRSTKNGIGFHELTNGGEPLCC